MMNNRAFMVHPGRDDVSRAERFAEVRYLFRSDERRPSIWSDEFQIEIVSRLEEFGYCPDSDYLLVTGHLATVTMFIGAVTGAWPDRRPLALFYDKAQEDYVPKRLGVCPARRPA
jgi:hypothetical protein